jgi:hypothetical protein
MLTQALKKAFEKQGQKVDVDSEIVGHQRLVIFCIINYQKVTF